jgi:thioesterase domain-containing protein
MTADLTSPVVVLAGAGGAAPNFEGFRTRLHQGLRFELVSYPGWQQHVAKDFSAEDLITYLTENIITKVPDGSIRIVGMSLGGHLAYAAALRLKELGREIGGVCAIDSFMFTSLAPSPRWKGRAISDGLALLRNRQFGKFVHFLRSKMLRAILRLMGEGLPLFVRHFAPSGGKSSVDPDAGFLQYELTMRLLIQKTAPWIAALDRNPAPLMAPAALLRTRDAAGDDAAWRRRCPCIRIVEIPGQHQTFFNAENIEALRQAFYSATSDWI